MQVYKSCREDTCKVHWKGSTVYNSGCQFQPVESDFVDKYLFTKVQIENSM